MKNNRLSPQLIKNNCNSVNNNHQSNQSQKQHPLGFKYIEKSNELKNNQQNNYKFFPQSATHQRTQQNQLNLFISKSKDDYDKEPQQSKYGYNQISKQKSQIPKKLKTDVSQYDKLHLKLNFIEQKIYQMKLNLEKKKQQKRKKKQEDKIKLQNMVYQIQKLQQHQQINTQQTRQQQNAKLQKFVTRMPEHKQLESFEFDPYSPRSNIYYVSEIIKAYNISKSLARQHLITSLNILKMLENTKVPTKQQISKKIQNLPQAKRYQGKKTVVFDLDETLIHCNQNLQKPYDIKIPIKFPTGDIIEAGINIRPNAKEILKQLSQNFQIIVFTASHSCYANQVIDYLDPSGQYVQHRLYRQHCFQSPQNVYIKDLRVINRSLESMVLIDNAAYSYNFQLQNGIPIIPYYHGKNDFELKSLAKYIQQLIFVKDVRTKNRNTFKLDKYKNYYNKPEKLVEQLYLNAEK